MALDAVFKVDRLALVRRGTGHGAAHVFAIVGVDPVEPDRWRSRHAAVVVAEHLHAPSRVVDPPAHEVPVPQAVVGGERPQAVTLLARAELVVQELLIERGGEERGPLVVCLTAIGRQGVDLAHDGEEPEVLAARGDRDDDRD